MSTTDDSPKWAFPDVHYLVEDKIGEYNLSYQLRIYEDKIVKLENSLAEKQAEIERVRQDLAVLNHRIDELHVEKIKSVEGIKESLKKINNSISQDALQVIKVIAKKIILRELQSDDKTIKSMIDNILAKIITDEFTKIEVSEIDYKVLESAEFGNSIKLFINPNLDPGDIIISCQSGGVMLKLDEAIDSVLGH